jgi:hypothetical protein
MSAIHPRAPAAAIDAANVAGIIMIPDFSVLLGSSLISDSNGRRSLV